MFYYVFWKNIEIYDFSSLVEAFSIGLQGIILYFLIHFFYDLLLNVNLGGTLGKMALGLEIRKERNTDERMTYGQAVGRYFIKNIISSTFFYLGYLWAAFHDKKQSWHDRLAETVVIVKDKYTPALEPKPSPVPQPRPEQKSIGRKIGALVVTAGTGRGMTYDVKEPITVIGSDAGCDIVLDNDYHYVSRRHCEIFTKDSGVFIRHLSTTNPTLVNNMKVTELRLRDNDVITICDFTLRLKLF